MELITSYAKSNQGQHLELKCDVMTKNQVKTYLMEIMKNELLNSYTLETIRKELSYCQDLLDMVTYLENYKNDFVCFDKSRLEFFILYSENDYMLYCDNCDLIVIKK